MKRFITIGVLVAALSIPFTSAAYADDPHSGGSTGQPSQSCQSQPSSPGNSSSAPGSPFGGGTADSHYAGNQPQNSNNPNSVSQYDVACFQVSN